MKTCKFCKHGYMYYSQCRGLPPCAYCYLKHGQYPEKKDPDDTCPDWEPDDEEEEEE
jgi:hypothetical protein